MEEQLGQMKAEQHLAGHSEEEEKCEINGDKSDSGRVLT